MNEDLEKALRASLRREPAPPDFAAKVLAKATANQMPGPRVVSMDVVTPKRQLQRPMLMALAAMLAGMAIIPAVMMDYQRQEQARGLKAKQDLLTALAITKTQLQQAREKVQRGTKVIQ